MKKNNLRFASEPLSLRFRIRRFVYKQCRRYVDAYNGENNDDIRTNGELKLMYDNLSNAKMVFDVGANIGDWAKLALKINGSICLHCFEPSVSTFSRLIKNNFSSNVIFNNFGLSSSSGNVELHIFEEGSGMNSLYFRNGLEDGWGISPQSKSETIELRTLDDYCNERGVEFIDFLKVDIEGHELEFFKGAVKMLELYRIRMIQFEYGGCNIDSRVFLKDIFEFFSAYPKYRFYKIFPDFLKPAERYNQQFENFQYQNWAIVCDVD